MKIPFIGQIELTSLRSKVARHLFFLLFLSTFLPLTVLAFLSILQTSKDLRTQAGDRLHEACKTAGMTILERLRFLESDFDILISDLRKERSQQSLVMSLDRLKRLKNHFPGIIVSSANGTQIQYGTAIKPPVLSAEELDHLRNDKTLIITSPGATNRLADIFMVRALAPSSPSQWIVYGRLSSNILWGGEGSVSPLRHLLVTDRSGNVIFLSDPFMAPLIKIVQGRHNNGLDAFFTWTIDREEFLASSWMLFIKPRFDAQWIITHSQPTTDMLGSLSHINTIVLLIAGLTLMMVLLLTVNQIRKRLIPVETLISATRKITDKDFTGEVMIESNDEFEELGMSFNNMTNSIRNHFRVMDTINQIGITLSAERDSNRIMMDILNGAKIVTHADGYSLFLLNEDRHIQLETMTIDSLDLVSGSSVSSPIPFYGPDGAPNIKNVIVYSAQNKETVNIPDIYLSQQFDFQENFDFDNANNYRTRSLLCVPMLDHEDKVIGVLQLINANPAHAGTPAHFTTDDQVLIQTLSSEAGIALSKNRLIEDLKNLFDALVELISKAIDEKSPYTGGHSRRVADLAIMIANAISKEREGPFKNIVFSDAELYEIRIASLLHDCGKVSTPTHIMDKATRLQGIFDRIQLVDTRFEILKRDIQISHGLNLTTPDDSADSGITDRTGLSLDTLREDMAFISKCNSGERTVTEQDKERIIKIGNRYKWTTMEGNEESVLSEDEIYNLTVSKGTITPEERDLINEHINLTIKMLESLPYPDSLRNLPVIVATHHERSDGSGYPKGLKGDQIPLQGRILAIADVFEALLARDRPYKKGKMVSEAVHTLGIMKQKGEIDSDVFDIFMKKEIFYEYAEKYIPEEQIDRVDLPTVPGYSPVP